VGLVGGGPSEDGPDGGSTRRPPPARLAALGRPKNNVLGR